MKGAFQGLPLRPSVPQEADLWWPSGFQPGSASGDEREGGKGDKETDKDALLDQT